MTKTVTKLSPAVFSQYNSNFAKSLNAVFYWYNEIFSYKITDSSKKFLGSDLEMKLVSISEKDNFFFSDNEFFVTKIKLTEDICVFFRISSDMMSTILDLTLGERDTNFVPDMITELEAKLLTAYNNFLYKNIEGFLKIKEECDNDNFAHFTFITKFFGQNCGKLVVSIPVSALPEPKPKKHKPSFDLNSFPDMCTELNICTGKTQMTLKELKSLEYDDLVVLEKSSVKVMTLRFNGQAVDFNIIPNPKIIENVGNLPEGENDMNFNTGSDANMWDVIPVDVCAEFEKVKMTLGEIKAISEGSAIDVGSIYENKIYLKVESKVVAEGELIIINDKYAVRITDVLGKNEQPRSNEVPIEMSDNIPEMSANDVTDADIAPEPETEAVAEYNSDTGENGTEENENFDDGDFDIEDDNI